MFLSKRLLKEAEDKYHSLISSAREKGIKLPLDSELIKKLKRVFIISDFVTKTLIKMPSILKELVETDALNRNYSITDYREKLDKELSIEDDKELFSKKLRLIRNKEMVRIALRDLLNIVDISTIMKELSFFAEACIDRVAEFYFSSYCKKFGIPVGSNSRDPQNIVVIGLGKLGGEELNFSSDIDIMFAYPEAGITSTGLSNDEFFSYLCRAIISMIGEYSQDGFVFRVDTRLRPFGKSGPIVMNFDSIEEYYQTYGREWERYALIKARIVGGDRKRGNELLNRLSPFVYRKYLDYTVFDSLRQMKQKIINETKHITILDNIKTGPGGIREIEFFVQVFQLLRGGIDSELQSQNLLNTINVLEEKGYVPAKICNGLKEAYIFFRKIENRLQEYNDLQTHTIPDSSEQREKIAISMNFSDWEKLYDTLMSHASFVHRQFEELLSLKDTGRSRFSSVWDADSKESIKKILISEGVDSADTIASAIYDLKESPSTKSLTPVAKNMLSRLIPLVLKKAIKVKADAETFLRIIELIKKIQKRTTYISLMIENPVVIEHLLELAKYGPWVISFVEKFPVVLDELIDPRILYTPPSREEMEREIKHRLKNIDPMDLESQMTQLAIFRHANTLRIAAADISGSISVMEVSTYLTDIAEVVLDTALNLAWKYSLRRLNLYEIPEKKGFCVIGYGKLGGRELSYGSDLDLVFIHSGDNTLFYTKVAQTLIHILTTYTMMGKAYEVDTRLRPDGSSGILAVGIDAFREYQLSRAWTWEHQSILRARPVCGDNGLMDRFQQIRKEVLLKKRDKKKLFMEIWDMRNRIIKQFSKQRPGMFHLKYDPGGIIDIEFLIQYMTLLNLPFHPELLRWTAHIYFLEELTRLELIKKEDAEFIIDAYIRMRYMIHRLSLQGRPPIVQEDEFRQIRNRVNHIWKKMSLY